MSVNVEYPALIGNFSHNGDMTYISQLLPSLVSVCDVTRTK